MIDLVLLRHLYRHDHDIWAWTFTSGSKRYTIRKRGHSQKDSFYLALDTLRRLVRDE